MYWVHMFPASTVGWLPMVWGHSIIHIHGKYTSREAATEIPPHTLQLSTTQSTKKVCVYEMWGQMQWMHAVIVNEDGQVSKNEIRSTPTKKSKRATTTKASCQTSRGSGFVPVFGGLSQEWGLWFTPWLWNCFAAAIRHNLNKVAVTMSNWKDAKEQVCQWWGG